MFATDMAAIHEGQEFGIGDFVLLENVDMSSFMQNLQHRYDIVIVKSINREPLTPEPTGRGGRG